MTEIVRKAFFDPTEREFKFATFQDVEPIIEQNRQLQKEAQRGDFRHKASIPLNLIHMWLQEEWDKGNTGIRWDSEEFERVIHQKLADPDYAYLLTSSAHVQGFLGFGS